MSVTSIEWTDRTWNPVRGCSRVSEGCRHCYAERVAARFSGGRETAGVDEDGPFVGREGPFVGFAEMHHGEPRWTGRVELVPSKLDEPLRWRKPCRVFVNSMSDLFHESLPDEAIDQVFAVMALAPQHTFQVLTKRPKRMLDYLRSKPPGRKVLVGGKLHPGTALAPHEWPLPNVWLGVSVEDQETANERVPLLLETPAAVRFVSYEPALGPADFERWMHDSDCLASEVPFCICSTPREVAVDWIIVGGESGPGARPFDVAWARSTIAQCEAAGVACFVKQLGSYAVLDPRYDRSISGASRKLSDRKGGDQSEWPEDLRVREFPAACDEGAR